MPEAPTTGAFPGFAADSVAQAQRRYLEAWAGASQIMGDAAQTLLQRHAEMTNATLRRLWAGQTALVDGSAAPAALRPEQQLEGLSDLYEIAFAHCQELAAIILKAQTESLEVLAHCADARAEDARRAAA